IQRCGSILFAGPLLFCFVLPVIDCGAVGERALSQAGPGTMTLSGERVYKSYGSRTVLENCSLSVSTGESVLRRVPSGGGKSTFLRILALLEPADSGFVCHGERRWEAKDREDVSPYPFLTMVFQQLFLWPNLTMRQNLSIVLRHHPSAALPQS